MVSMLQEALRPDLEVGQSLNNLIEKLCDGGS